MMHRMGLSLLHYNLMIAFSETYDYSLIPNLDRGLKDKSFLKR